MKKTLRQVCRFALFVPLSIMPVSASLPSFQQSGSVLMMSNVNVQVQYNLSSGRADFYWQNAKKVAAFYSGVGLSSGYVTGNTYSNRTWMVVSSNQVLVTSSNAGRVMKQYFMLDQDNSFLARVEMDGTNLSANWMGPVVMDTAGGVDVGTYNDNRALFVPFDNDGFVRYNAESINGSDTGNEVGAFYDNTTRHGLVVGSVTHDTWKTGVYWSGSNNKLNALNVFGGVTSHWTWDVMPHGSVTGTNLLSPWVFVGFGNDWRATIEAFADENALFAPKLAWTNGMPFGWNSWGVTNYQTRISYSNAIAVSDSIHTNLQPYGFANNGTVYVNLDSYWDNMNDSQLLSFTAHCHANGQKAGIYWSPFVWWGATTNAGNSIVEGSSYFYSDVLLRDGNGNYETNDGAVAMDPTHPGAKLRVNYYVNRFTNEGFDFIKLDFLSHGSREGVHYDPTVTTGIQAYNQGMQYVFNQLRGRMFISESIAPIFPYQYAHSRRIACDAEQSRISNTEYTINSVSYGWWADRIYSFNDPDIIVSDNGPDTNENQSRLISAAVTGLFLSGDIMTNAATIAKTQSILTNAAISAVIRQAQSFRPVEGNTASSATDILARQDGPGWLIAVFNYASTATNRIVDLVRAGPGAATYIATDLWSGSSLTVLGTLNVGLNAKQSKLFRLSSLPPPFITRITALSGNVTLAGTGGVSNGTFRVLTSTNAASPIMNWVQFGTGFFDGNGAFSFHGPINSSERQRFYRVQTP